nr:hypothetical protein GCM10020093_073670 [Planobispora longispora]
MPSTLSLISHMFKDPKQQSAAIGVWMGCFLLGAILGPVVGGAMLQFFWWGSVFLLAVPVTVFLLAVGPRTLPEFRNPDAGRIDLPSVVLSLAAVLPFIYGLKQISREGVGPWPCWPSSRARSSSRSSCAGSPGWPTRCWT